MPKLEKDILIIKVYKMSDHFGSHSIFDIVGKVPLQFPLSMQMCEGLNPPFNILRKHKRMYSI